MRQPIKIAALAVCLLLAVPVFGAKNWVWIEVRSPHFIVVSNAGEKQARKTAIQFEQIRSLFRDSLENATRFSSPVITVLAAKDEDSIPYEAFYHEYYHSLTVPYFTHLPTWLAEGLAEFYGNSEVGDKEATMGIPSVQWLNELKSHQLIPLDVLFKVDQKSPYYKRTG